MSALYVFQLIVVIVMLARSFGFTVYECYKHGQDKRDTNTAGKLALSVLIYVLQIVIISLGEGREYFFAFNGPMIALHIMVTLGVFMSVYYLSHPRPEYKYNGVISTISLGLMFWLQAWAGMYWPLAKLFGLI